MPKQLKARSSFSLAFAANHIRAKTDAGAVRNRHGSRLRDLAFEKLEARLALTINIYSWSYESNGALNEGTTQIRVGFNTSAIRNMEDISNYELQRAGSDKLLSPADAVIRPIFATTRFQTEVILQFPRLEEDVYRLTVKDTIIGSNFAKLDGDDDGSPGGNWVEDFVVNSLNNDLEPVSKAQMSAPNGSASHVSGERTISADGRFVTFLSEDSNLAPGDHNGLVDVYWKDMVTGDVKIASTSRQGNLADNTSSSPSISASGQYVVFESLATNLVEPSATPMHQILVKDMDTGLVRIASSNSSGVAAPLGGSNPMISADGRYVSFSSLDNTLVPNDTNNSSDVFIKDMVSGAITLISKTSDGVIGNGDSAYPYMSNNGTYVAFRSAATNLSANDSNTFQDIYLIRQR